MYKLCYNKIDNTSCFHIMHWLEQYYWENDLNTPPRRAWYTRAFNILRQPAYHKNQLSQFWETIRHPEVNYDMDPDKRTIAVIPGLSCSVPTYAALINEITKNWEFNVLKLEEFPENWRAIFSWLSLTERAKLLLDVLEKHDNWPVDLIWHSIGWPVAAYAKIIGDEDKIGKIITLSAPMSWSRWLANLPILPRQFRSLWELEPDSDFMQKLNDEGKVDHRFVTQRDEIIRLWEMDFHNGEEHLLNHGHFDYMLGAKDVVADTASQIVDVLNR